MTDQSAEAVERIMKACRDADVCPKTQQAITAEITAAYEKGLNDFRALAAYHAQRESQQPREEER